MIQTKDLGYNNRFWQSGLAFCFAVIVLMLVIGSGVSAFSGSGSGTSADPYQITTTGQWNEMQNSPSSYYVLNNDLNWGGGTPTQIYPFTGNFDGKGHIISNFIVPYGDTNGGATGYGLFSDYGNEGGVIKNLGIVGATGQAPIVIGITNGLDELSGIAIDNTTSVSITGTTGLVGDSVNYITVAKGLTIAPTVTSISGGNGNMYIFFGAVNSLSDVVFNPTTSSTFNYIIRGYDWGTGTIGSATYCNNTFSSVNLGPDSYRHSSFCIGNDDTEHLFRFYFRFDSLENVLPDRYVGWITDLVYY